MLKSSIITSFAWLAQGILSTIVCCFSSPTVSAQICLKWHHLYDFIRQYSWYIFILVLALFMRFKTQEGSKHDIKNYSCRIFKSFSFEHVSMIYMFSFLQCGLFLLCFSAGGWRRRWTSIWVVHVKTHPSQEDSGWCDYGENSGQENRDREPDVWYVHVSWIL